MSKRRINKQQSKRIAQLQKDYQLEDQDDQSLLADGLVITRFGRHAELENRQGLTVHCSIRPNIDSLVAGDEVVWRTEGLAQGVIVSRYPRRSVLSRPHARGVEKPVAANITQLIIVIAAKPEISWSLLDSYLIMSETLGLDAIILLNKTDLPCTEIKETLIRDYEPLGYPLLFCQSRENTGDWALEALLKNQVSVFVGQSGVGKSSIISSILPHETGIETQAISENSELGRHTTSNSRYYHLRQGGALIDSPGVREFNLVQTSTADIIKGYREFKPYLPQCKFRNCNHIDSLGCAIREAMTEGKISKTRYNNFLKLCQQYEKR